MSGWSVLVAAIGLVFVIEGLLCLAAPNLLRKTMTAMLELSNAAIQRMGIASAVIGAIVLWLFV